MTPTAVVDRIGRPAAQLVLTVAAVAVGGIIAVTVAWALPYALLCIVAMMWLTRHLEQDAAPPEEPRQVRLRTLRQNLTHA